MNEAFFKKSLSLLYTETPSFDHIFEFEIWKKVIKFILLDCEIKL